MKDGDELLRGGDRLEDLLADRALLDRLTQLPRDRKVDIGLEERLAHEPQPFLDVPLGEAIVLGEGLECPGEGGGEGFEHAGARTEPGRRRGREKGEEASSFGGRPEALAAPVR